LWNFSTNYKVESNRLLFTSERGRGGCLLIICQKKCPDAGEEADSAGGVGPRWGCLSQDRATRFVVAWGFGSSEDEVAPKGVAQTRQRTSGGRGVIWIRDGRPVDRQAVRRADRDAQPTGKRGRPPLAPPPGVGLTQAVKRRHQGRMVRVEVRQVLGEAVDGPYPVHEERLNGMLRDRLNALTRKTHAFAKTTGTWDALVILCLFEHNWLRPHRALREAGEGLPEGRRYRPRTPAMAIGLTDHIWTWEEFLTFKHYQYQKE